MQGVNKIGFITIWQWWAAVSKNGWTFGTFAMFIPALGYFSQWNPHDFYKTQGRKWFFATYTFFYSLALMIEYVVARGILFYKLAEKSCQPKDYITDWFDPIRCYQGSILISCASYSLWFLPGLALFVHSCQILYTYAYYFEEVENDKDKKTESNEPEKESNLGKQDDKNKKAKGKNINVSAAEWPFQTAHDKLVDEK